MHRNKMNKKTSYVLLFLLLCSNTVVANNVLEKKLKQQSKKSAQTYMATHSNQKLDPSSQQEDVSALASSVEFEFFKITEDSVSHTVFKSNAGICYGFKEGTGVQVTDSTTYYMVKNTQDEYYLNIAGAEIEQGKLPKEMQYVPVFHITDKNMLKNIKEEDQTIGALIAEENIKERTKVLSNVVCK